MVEDAAHGLDDATLDVLRELAGRIEGSTGVLVLTFRADEARPGTPVVGAARGARWCARTPGCGGSFSAAAVTALAHGRDGASLHELTAGNPFFVTEVLAAPLGSVPRTVADAAVARLGQLRTERRAACEQLAVVPTGVGFELAERPLGDRFDALDEAEERGMIEVRDGGLAFRHELARRAVEANLPAIRRRLLNRRSSQRCYRSSPGTWIGSCTTR